jgi:hypothetical protein
MAFLKVCDAIFIVDVSDIYHSKGVKAEFDWASENKLPIYYTLKEVWNV